LDNKVFDISKVINSKEYDELEHNLEWNNSARSFWQNFRGKLPLARSRTWEYNFKMDVVRMVRNLYASRSFQYQYMTSAVVIFPTLKTSSSYLKNIFFFFVKYET